MHPETKQALQFAAVMAAIVAANYVWRGTADVYLVVTVVLLITVVAAWTVVAVRGASRRERAILDNLSKLGGRATLSQLEETLFDTSTSYAKVQGLRDSLVFLKERGRITEVEDQLVLTK